MPRDPPVTSATLPSRFTVNEGYDRRLAACQDGAEGPMAVYIDDARIRWRGRFWSHPVADSPEGLHDAAPRLGPRRGWAQGRGRAPHPDPPDELRARGVSPGGAQPLGPRGGGAGPGR